MKIKKLLLAIITVVSLIPVFLSLVNSVHQPQSQSNFQLYQTNLILKTSQIFDNDHQKIKSISQYISGQQPYIDALKKYSETHGILSDRLDELSTELKTYDNNTIGVKEEILSLNSSNISDHRKKILTDIDYRKKTLSNLNLKIGLLEVAQGNTKQALDIWKNNNSLLSPSSSNKLSDVLINLWNNSFVKSDDAEFIIKENLNGWFLSYSLKRLYEIEDRQQDLQILQAKYEKNLQSTILKLAFLNIIPGLGSVVGIGIIIFSLIQLILRQDSAILNISSDYKWEIPWTVETPWKVFIIGFFFFGQIILPALFTTLNINLINLSLRGKAIYIFSSYLIMALGGILVLYLSIKPFFPLPQKLFNFKIFKNWIIWGISGYLVALPSVLIISLINDNFWGGKGGSNPLLSLVLENQDLFALAIFYLTAAVAAPFYEEIIFRGFLLPSLTRYISPWGAIIVSSLIFAVAHLNISEILPLTTLGIILGVVYTRSGNLLSSILMHSLWNTGTLVSLFLLGTGGN